MDYLAHKREEDGATQSLKDHLENTAEIAGKFAEEFGAYDWGYCAGMLHDIGKYSAEFQRRINGSEEKVDHATAGAQLCWNMKGMYQFLSYCIAGHHAGLPDTGGKTDTGSCRSLYGRLKKQIKDYEAYQKEITIPKLSTPGFMPSDKAELSFFCSMLVRMVYSCLVDADFLDTEDFMNGGIKERDSGEPMEILYERLKTHISGWLENENRETVNGRRTEILKNCLEKGDEERGLFRLTVPTGGGKTVASLAFALRHAIRHEMKHIIYVIPYTSIIEQNAKVFSDILGERNVLESHCNVDYESTEELRPMQLATENWDKPVIVTTNVSFFESLFSNKSSKCRKLHNLANSVIIFDEAQMLPNDYLKPCIAAMEQLVRYFRSTIVLCTATQPALTNMFSEGMEAKELCPRMEEQFRFFTRAVLEDLGRIPGEELIQRLEGEEQALCILNTKKKAQKVYQCLREEGVYHLSTSMYPEHRRKVLAEIRNRLKNNEKCIVISTSLVEAGVDLDFRTVYRQLAGTDSIIQAVGRCNREGKRPLEESHTWIFQLEEREYTPGQSQQIAVTEALLSEEKRLEELSTIQEYFEMLYHFRGSSLDKKEILKEFQGMRFSFKKVSDEFKLIEQNTKTILIPREEHAKEIYKEMKIKGITKKLMREAGQYCISVYEEDCNKMICADMIRVITDELKDFYVLKNTDQYKEDMGLKLDLEYGQAVIF
ncbi:MAG: CRISPR-associated helicase Cas3' [Lachnospiraceae bacterium]|nr:CRISPR-associated helicase Cas3' [Lachnospiraceae bacterium]